MSQPSIATPLNYDDDDLLAGLPTEEEMRGKTIMPPDMPHFDFDPDTATTAPSVTEDSVERRMIAYLKSQREGLEKLAAVRQERISERPVAGPMTQEEFEQMQRDTLALADQNTARKEARQNDANKAAA